MHITIVKQCFIPAHYKMLMERCDSVQCFGGLLVLWMMSITRKWFYWPKFEYLCFVTVPCIT